MFEGLGYPVSGASAPVGNFVQEVGADLPCKFRNGKLDHGSQGLAQWRLQRLENYLNFVKGRPGTFETVRDAMATQVAFVDYELRTDYPKLHAKLMAGGDVAALTADFCWQFERPNKALSGIERRIAAAKALATVGTQASKELGVSTNSLAPFNVVDHLQRSASAHQTEAKGGTIAASICGLLGVSTFVPRLSGGDFPWWMWVVSAVFLILLVGFAWVAMNAAEHARNLRQAIGNVTPDAPPAAEVVSQEVLAPAVVDPKPPEPTSSYADDVRAEVERQLAAMGIVRIVETQTDPLHPSNAGREWVAEARADAAESGHGSVTGNDATMSIGRAKP